MLIAVYYYMFSAVLSARRMYLVFTCISQDIPESAAIDAASLIVMQGAGIIMFVSCNCL